ncbi:MAG: 50S ribosomal protein L35 [Opitutales bacterium]|nr:50S ribosomal protein L35 [Opitutales bacterium]|tara:strand:- start:480 stop:674 length:195 start_codon:yes stop_codon:yes gene_type:complete
MSSGKTHKGIAKRFKITGTGKVVHRKPGHRHILRTKTVKQRRSARQDQGLAKGMSKRVKAALRS